MMSEALQIPLPQLPQLNWDLLLSWQSWALIAIFILVLAMAVWRRVAPGFPGIARGVYTVTAFYSGRYFDDITGNLVEFTDYVLAPEYQRAFIEYVRKQLPGLTKFLAAKSRASNPSSGNPSGGRQKAFLEQVEVSGEDEVNRIAEMIRNQTFTLSAFGDLRLIVNGVRTITARHVFLSFIDAGKVFPDDYVAVREKASMNILMLDWVNRGLVNGYDYELPETWHVPGIGKVHVHLYFPIPIEDQSPIPVNAEELKKIAKLALFARFTWEVRDALGEKDRVITEKEQEIRGLRREVSALTTAQDASQAAVSAFSTEKKRSLTGEYDKRSRQLDALIYVIAAIFGGFAAQYMHFDVMMGSVASLVAAAIFTQIWRR